MSLGKHILGRKHVYPSAASGLTILQVEGTFTTGTHLVTVDQPISTADGDIEMALYGSFLPIPPDSAFPAYSESEYDTVNGPGAIMPAHDNPEVELNPGRKRTRVRVTNRGDRPIQVGDEHFTDIKPCPLLIITCCCAGRIAFPLHRNQPHAGL